jgi:hypothetical protein
MVDAVDSGNEVYRLRSFCEQLLHDLYAAEMSLVDATTDGGEDTYAAEKEVERRFKQLKKEFGYPLEY